MRIHINNGLFYFHYLVYILNDKLKLFWKFRQKKSFRSWMIKNRKRQHLIYSLSTGHLKSYHPGSCTTATSYTVVVMRRQMQVCIFRADVHRLHIIDEITIACSKNLQPRKPESKLFRSHLYSHVTPVHPMYRAHLCWRNRISDLRR